MPLRTLDSTFTWHSSNAHCVRVPLCVDPRCKHPTSTLPAAASKQLCTKRINYKEKISSLLGRGPFSGTGKANNVSSSVSPRRRRRPRGRKAQIIRDTHLCVCSAFLFLASKLRRHSTVASYIPAQWWIYVNKDNYLRVFVLRSLSGRLGCIFWGRTHFLFLWTAGISWNRVTDLLVVGFEAENPCL